MKLKPQEELMRAWPAQWKVPTVVVRCIVFNHENFVERCLQGFLIQETSFPFEVFIHDDASTDNSADIIRRYAERYPLILKPVYESENLWSKNDGSFFRAAWGPILHGGYKYIALCDGDDYWTDPKKLQKQVEYMEEHPGCAGCFHERVTCTAQGRLTPGTGLPDAMKHALTGDEIAAWTFPCPPTCTMLLRHEVLMSRPDHLNKWFAGDRATALWAAYSRGTMDWVGGVKPSVYRIHSGGVCQGRNELDNIIHDHKICRQTLESFPVSRWARSSIHEKMLEQTFRAWWKWHGSESEETRKSVQDLVKDNIASYPVMRWRLFGKRARYYLSQWCCRAWHGVVMGTKRVLPGRLYGWLREGGRKRKAGGET